MSNPLIDEVAIARVKMLDGCLELAGLLQRQMCLKAQMNATDQIRDPVKRGAALAKVTEDGHRLSREIKTRRHMANMEISDETRAKLKYPEITPTDESQCEGKSTT